MRARKKRIESKVQCTHKNVGEQKKIEVIKQNLNVCFKIKKYYIILRGLKYYTTKIEKK